jgi:hypothetical protein
MKMKTPQLIAAVLVCALALSRDFDWPPAHRQ